MVVKKVKKGKKRILKVTEKGNVFIQATFNNTLVCVTDRSGDVICSGSCGSAGFKGARKSTPFAATTAIERVLSKAIDLGVREIDVYIKGPGPGRDAALRVLRSMGMTINKIADITPIPHNGCRPKKRRRV